MKAFLPAGCLLLGALTVQATDFNSQTYNFNWANPASLTPSYPVPDMNNRYGEYISNEEFTIGPLSLVVNDDDVAQQSQKARFLYGYMSQTVEMRAYYQSVITISASGNETISAVTWTDVDPVAEKLEYIGSQGTFKNNRWTVSDDYLGQVTEVKFFVWATLNCTNTAVTTVKEIGSPDDDQSSVSDIADNANTPTQWFTLQGMPINGCPDTPGIYIRRQDNHTSKIIIK